MNQIRAEKRKSSCSPQWEFMDFKIDDEFLSTLLVQKYPDEFLNCLIPTLNAELFIEKERKLVWDSILPSKLSICPILMCEDDCDFSCTLIVAEIEKQLDIVFWRRIGINLGDFNRKPKIKWLNAVPSYSFSIKNYLKLVEDFKTDFESEIN